MMGVKPVETNERPRTRPELLVLLDHTMRAAGAQRILYSAALADRLGLRQTDLECLYIITLNDNVTPGRLAAETGLTTGAITGVIDRIEKLGYIRRARDPADRRRIFLQPVSERIEEIRQANRHMRDLWMDEIVGYSDDELRFLVDFATRNYRSTVAATMALCNENASGNPTITRLPDRIDQPDAGGAGPARAARGNRKTPQP